MGHIHLPLKEVTLKLEWIDQIGFTGKTFQTVQELAEFLKEYPPLAQAVNYISKTKQ
jgi:hypothetical protein